MKARGVGHVLILGVHRKEYMDYVEHLPASNVSLLSLALLVLRLFDFLTEQVCITWDAPHKSLEEKRVKTDEAA